MTGTLVIARWWPKCLIVLGGPFPYFRILPGLKGR